MHAEAVAMSVTYEEAERLCRRHLADRRRTSLRAPQVVRYELREDMRFKPAHPSVSTLLLERLAFDRAFRQLEREERRILWLWYVREDLTAHDIAYRLVMSVSTASRRRRAAVRSLAKALDS